GVFSAWKGHRPLNCEPTRFNWTVRPISSTRSTRALISSVTLLTGGSVRERVTPQAGPKRGDRAPLSSPPERIRSASSAKDCPRARHVEALKDLNCVAIGHAGNVVRDAALNWIVALVVSQLRWQIVRILAQVLEKLLDDEMRLRIVLFSGRVGIDGAEHELTQLVDNFEHGRAHANGNPIADGLLPCPACAAGHAPVEIDNIGHERRNA